MYFQLVQCYGDVPLHLEEVTGADNAFLPRSSVNDIYTAIVDDVKDAIEKLPTVKFPQNGAGNQRSCQNALRLCINDKARSRLCNSGNAVKRYHEYGI